MHHDLITEFLSHAVLIVSERILKPPLIAKLSANYYVDCLKGSRQILCHCLLLFGMQNPRVSKTFRLNEAIRLNYPLTRSSYPEKLIHTLILKVSAEVMSV